MKAVLLKCRDGTQFRLGSTSLDNVSSVLHADTLFSALTNIYALVFDDADGFVDEVRTGKVLVSSGFYALTHPKADKPVFFVPKPELKYIIDEGKVKQLKKIQFVSLGVLKEIKRHLTEADGVWESKVDILKQKRVQKLAMLEAEWEMLGGKVLTSKQKLIAEQSSMHVKVNTESETDNLYVETNLALYQDAATKIQAHLYFFLDETLSSERYKRFMTCLRILADEGIGGSRSIGCGWFDDIEIHDVTWESSQAQLYYSLSLVIPETQEAFEQVVSYNLMNRVAGFQGYDNRRTRLTMIQEGSLWQENIKGSLLSVGTTEAPIFRYANNFVLPL